MKNREWRQVTGCAHEVSNDGQVRSLSARWPSMQGHVLAQHIKLGYAYVSLSIGGKRRTCLVHRLVAEAFVGPCPSGYDVNHLDANKSNNVVGNLEYVTRTGNMRHAARLGLLTSKLTPAEVLSIRARASAGEAHPSIARAFGVAKGTIWKIVNAWGWKHVGGPTTIPRVERPSEARCP